MSNDHPAIRPLNPKQQFWAVMAWQGLVTVTRINPNVKPTILAYHCKEAREIVITPHVKTFIYFCHASESWDVHETSTGVRIAGGGSITDAVEKTKQWFREANEEMFFKQLRGMGPYTQHGKVPYDQAMLYLQAGEKENPTMAMIRRRQQFKA